MRVALVVLIFFITLSALPSGILLIMQPDGSSLGLSMNLLEGTPFRDFFIPGLALALIVGGCNLVSLFLVMTSSPNAYKFTLTVGVVLVLLIVAELMLMPYYHWLQGLYLAIGILVVLTSYQLMGRAFT